MDKLGQTLQVRRAHLVCEKVHESPIHFQRSAWNPELHSKSAYVRVRHHLFQLLSFAYLQRGEKTMAAIAKLRDEFCANEEILKTMEQNHDKTKDKKKFAETELTDRDWHALTPGSQNVKYKSGEIIIDVGVANNHLIRIR